MLYLGNILQDHGYCSCNLRRCFFYFFDCFHYPSAVHDAIGLPMPIIKSQLGSPGSGSSMLGQVHFDCIDIEGLAEDHVEVGTADPFPEHFVLVDAQPSTGQRPLRQFRGNLLGTVQPKDFYRS